MELIDKATTATPSKPQVTQDGLMELLGIDKSQIEVNKTVTTSSQEPADNHDRLKVDAKEQTKVVNERNGELVSFVALKRQGTIKDSKGNYVLDDDGNKRPRFIQEKKEGHWTIDKTQDGFVRVSRMHYYTESFIVTGVTMINQK